MEKESASAACSRIENRFPLFACFCRFWNDERNMEVSSRGLQHWPDARKNRLTTCQCGGLAAKIQARNRHRTRFRAAGTECPDTRREEWQEGRNVSRETILNSEF